MDGLDASQGLLDQARRKGVYTQHFCCYLDHTRLPIKDGELGLGLVLDASQCLLEQARGKGVYSQHFCCYLDHTRLPIKDGELL